MTSLLQRLTGAPRPTSADRALYRLEETTSALQEDAERLGRVLTYTEVVRRVWGFRGDGGERG